MPRQSKQQKTSPPKWPLIIISIILLFLVGYIVNKNLYRVKEKLTEQNPSKNIPAPSPQAQTPPVTGDTKAERIAQYEKEEDTLTPRPESWTTVPFTPQAPTANWDELHNEACEEASAIMVAAALKAQDTNTGEQVDISPEYISTENPPDQYYSKLDPSFVESEITKLTDWENDNLGYHLSINTYEAARMIEEVYNLDTEVVPYNVSKLKKVLGGGKRMIILPANGQLLKNPNFKQPGPIYHMFVVTGYNATQIITNDPGTRKGYNYKYDYSTVKSAVGNWEPDPHAVNLDNKLMIIVSRK